jgi:hypothetical protein
MPTHTESNKKTTKFAEALKTIASRERENSLKRSVQLYVAGPRPARLPDR